MDLTSKVVSNDASFEAFKLMLQSANLPIEDLNYKNQLLIGFYQENTMVATGGLETYGSLALLRSLSVKAGIRGQSLGSIVTAELIQQAKLKNVMTIYLLTETAHAFFLKKGFQDVARTEVPTEIKASSEFTHVCPATAICMKFVLDSSAR